MRGVEPPEVVEGTPLRGEDEDGIPEEAIEAEGAWCMIKEERMEEDCPVSCDNVDGSYRLGLGILESLEEEEDKLFPEVDLAIPRGGREFKMRGALGFIGTVPWVGGT